MGVQTGKANEAAAPRPRDDGALGYRETAMEHAPPRSCAPPIAVGREPRVLPPRLSHARRTAGARAFFPRVSLRAPHAGAA